MAWEERHGVDSPLELNRSLYLMVPDKFGNGSYTGRLGPLLTKWSRGERTAQIGIAGSSVSFGSELEKPSDAWPHVLMETIRHVWPRSKSVLHIGAKPATTAAFGAVCYDSIFRIDHDSLDLLLIEYSWNTDVEGDMEALVATALGRGAAVMAIDYQQCALDARALACARAVLMCPCPARSGVRTQAWKSCGMDLSLDTQLNQMGATRQGVPCHPSKIFGNAGRVKHWRVFAPDAAPFYGYYVCATGRTDSRPHNFSNPVSRVAAGRWHRLPGWEAGWLASSGSSRSVPTND